MNAPSVRLLAFYLPQYHPIPENDAWWGRGFTEWTNVTRARPQFRGHDQPHLPADLGFYDLRLPDAREAQAALARQYGIHGFCYYHYWFNGRRILERPFNDVLASGKPDFPFCLCWANENWSRRWDGGEKDLLLEQHYSEEDDRAHLRSLLPALRDPRYVRVDGRPVLMIYRASHLPKPAETVAHWRDEARRGGLPGIYLINVESLPSEHGLAPLHGFDAAVEFAPDWRCLGQPLGRSPLKNRFARYLWRVDPHYRHHLYEYPRVVERMLAKPAVPYLRFPGVTPSWDNTARRRVGATILTGSSPELYGQWLTETLRRFRPPTPDANLVFVNAWNEWAEGNHLEPCQRWGRAYLEATQRALGSRS